MLISHRLQLRFIVQGLAYIQQAIVTVLTHSGSTKYAEPLELSGDFQGLRQW